MLVFPAIPAAFTPQQQLLIARHYATRCTARHIEQEQIQLSEAVSPQDIVKCACQGLRNLRPNYMQEEYTTFITEDFQRLINGFDVTIDTSYGAPAESASHDICRNIRLSLSGAQITPNLVRGQRMKLGDVIPLEQSYTAASFADLTVTCTSIRGDVLTDTRRVRLLDIAVLVGNPILCGGASMGSWTDSGLIPEPLFGSDDTFFISGSQRSMHGTATEKTSLFVPMVKCSMRKNGTRVCHADMICYYKQNFVLRITSLLFERVASGDSWSIFFPDTFSKDATKKKTKYIPLWTLVGLFVDTPDEFLRFTCEPSTLYLDKLKAVCDDKSTDPELIPRLISQDVRRTPDDPVPLTRYIRVRLFPHLCEDTPEAAEDDNTRVLAMLGAMVDRIVSCVQNRFVTQDTLDNRRASTARLSLCRITSTYISELTSRLRNTFCDATDATPSKVIMDFKRVASNEALQDHMCRCFSRGYILFLFTRWRDPHLATLTKGAPPIVYNMGSGMHFSSGIARLIHGTDGRVALNTASGVRKVPSASLTLGAQLSMERDVTSLLHATESLWLPVSEYKALPEKHCGRCTLIFINSRCVAFTVQPKKLLASLDLEISRSENMHDVTVSHSLRRITVHCDAGRILRPVFDTERIGDITRDLIVGVQSFADLTSRMIQRRIIRLISVAEEVHGVVSHWNALTKHSRYCDVNALDAFYDRLLLLPNVINAPEPRVLYVSCKLAQQTKVGSGPLRHCVQQIQDGQTWMPAIYTSFAFADNTLLDAIPLDPAVLPLLPRTILSVRNEIWTNDLDPEFARQILWNSSNSLKHRYRDDGIIQVGQRIHQNDIICITSVSTSNGVVPRYIKYTGYSSVIVCDIVYRADVVVIHMSQPLHVKRGNKFSFQGGVCKGVVCDTPTHIRFPNGIQASGYCGAFGPLKRDIHCMQMELECSRRIKSVDSSSSMRTDTGMPVPNIEYGMLALTPNCHIPGLNQCVPNEFIPRRQNGQAKRSVHRGGALRGDWQNRAVCDPIALSSSVHFCADFADIPKCTQCTTVPVRTEYTDSQARVRYQYVCPRDSRHLVCIVRKPCGSESLSRIHSSVGADIQESYQVVEDHDEADIIAALREG